MQGRGLICNKLVAEAATVDEEKPAENMNEAHLSAQVDTGVVPVSPTLIPLTKVNRSVIRSQLAASRGESSLALVELRNPHSEVSILSCPELWKEKPQIKQVSYQEASQTVKNRSTLRKFIEELRPRRFVSYSTWSIRKTYKSRCRVQCCKPVHRDCSICGPTSIRDLSPMTQ